MTASSAATEAAAGLSAAIPDREDRGKKVPGQTAMWIFVLGDLFIFAGWFSFYMLYRMNAPEVFLESQKELNQALGVSNTLVLLLSSLFIALGVQNVRQKKYNRAIVYTVLTFLSGLIFAGSKLYEWTEKIQSGYYFTSNDFFMFYFFLTGVHVFHVLCGLIALSVVMREIRNPRLRSEEVIGAGATFWHMVDLLWVIIFALVYLMR